jgi:U3 small nucleolar RNA-associated protein 6
METEQSLFITEILEKSAPFLNECKFIEILADNEISKIISTRTDFEYKLLSTNKELDIYLRYLQFELNLLLLVSTRKKKKSLKHINRFGDYLNHVSFVFKRGLAIYRNEIKLWKAFIDFAVQYQYKTEQAFEEYAYLSFLTCIVL